MNREPPQSGSAGQARPSASLVLIALTERERKLFLPAPIPAELAGAVMWWDPEAAPAGNWPAVLREKRPVCIVSGWQTPSLSEAWLAEADCPLRYVCHVTGSVRRLVPRSFLARGGLVTNWGDTVGEQVAEHALLLALAALRNLQQWRPFMAARGEGRRIEELGTRTLFGRRVGLHGFGSVARALLPLLRPFGVSVAVFSAGVPPEVITETGAQVAGSLRELFAASEVLFECESLTPATEGSVSAGVLAALPAGAVFVNVGRGGVVDEAALTQVAATGKIRVALDVVRDEPLTPRSPLWALPDAILSPHIAGPTTDHYAACGSLALANVQRFLASGAPTGLISLAAYDRST
jgi:phosphoglycerate dehydrogenase-like enzyme